MQRVMHKGYDKRPAKYIEWSMIHNGFRSSSSLDAADRHWTIARIADGNGGRSVSKWLSSLLPYGLTNGSCATICIERTTLCQRRRTGKDQRGVLVIFIYKILILDLTVYILPIVMDETDYYPDCVAAISQTRTFIYTLSSLSILAALYHLFQFGGHSKIAKVLND